MTTAVKFKSVISVVGFFTFNRKLLSRKFNLVYPQQYKLQRYKNGKYVVKLAPRVMKYSVT